MTNLSPDPAASVLVLRPSETGFEVLMVKRLNRGFFGGLVVFPGGKVDEIDRTHSSPNTTAPTDWPFRNAGLRELAEETGLFAVEEGAFSAPGLRDERVLAELERRNTSFAIDDLTLISRWVTPEGAPRRFDTWFYLLGLAETPEVVIDPDELVDWAWVSPELALARYESGEWPMFLPTIAHLRWLAMRSSIDDAIRSAEGADGRTLIEPKRVEDGSIVPIHMPAEI